MIWPSKYGFFVCAAGFAYAVATRQLFEATICLSAAICCRGIWVSAAASTDKGETK